MDPYDLERAGKIMEQRMKKQSTGNLGGTADVLGSPVSSASISPDDRILGKRGREGEDVVYPSPAKSQAFSAPGPLPQVAGGAVNLNTTHVSAPAPGSLSGSAVLTAAALATQHHTHNQQQLLPHTSQQQPQSSNFSSSSFVATSPANLSPPQQQQMQQQAIYTQTQQYQSFENSLSSPAVSMTTMAPLHQAPVQAPVPQQDLPSQDTWQRSAPEVEAQRIKIAQEWSMIERAHSRLQATEKDLREAHALMGEKMGHLITLRNALEDAKRKEAIQMVAKWREQVAKDSEIIGRIGIRPQGHNLVEVSS
jgi:hypothetical protein